MAKKPAPTPSRAARTKPTGPSLSDIDRATALEAVLNNAPDIGTEAALKKFGAPLTKVEKNLIRSLTPEELTQLRNVKRKLGVFQGPGPNFI